MNKLQILLVGGGGHCRSCIDVIESEGRFDIAGIIEKDESVNQDVLGYPIIGTDDDLAALRKKFEYAFVTTGQLQSSEARESLFAKLRSLQYTLPVIISPHAIVSKHAALGEGTIAMHNAVVNAGAEVGKNCILNTDSLVEHDCSVGDHCHISTGAVINGEVTVGESSFIGSNAVVVQRVHTPISSFVKAAALVKSERYFSEKGN